MFFVYFIYLYIFDKYKVLLYSTNINIKNLYYDLKFIPTFYLPFSILQSIVMFLLNKNKIYYKRKYIITNKNITISLDFALTTNNSKNLVLIIHGFTGGSETSYVKSLTNKLTQYKYNVVIAHYRGVNDTPMSTNIGYHCDLIEDTEYVIEYIKSCNFLQYNKTKKILIKKSSINKNILKANNNYNINKFHLIGISNGANICSKILGSNKIYYSKFILSFVSVSNPFDFNAMQKYNHLNFLDRFILYRCKLIVSKHPILYTNKNLNIDKVKNVKSSKEFNENYSLIMFNDINKINNKNANFKDESNQLNYKTLEEYYNSASCRNKLINIDVDSLFINSDQDGLNYYCKDELKHITDINKKLNFIITSHGGHVSWSEGTFKLNRWYEDVLIKFINNYN